MAAFSAVASLNNTIERLLESSRISFVSPSREILELASKEVKSLKHFLEKNERVLRKRCESEEVMALEEEMREEVWKLEDVLESCVSTQMLSQSETHPLQQLFSISLLEVREALDSFSETAKKMGDEYCDNNPLQLDEDQEDDDDDDDDDDDESVVSSKAYLCGNSPIKMVGFADVFDETRAELFKDCRRRKYVTIVGMAGVGKTTLAKKILEDPEVMEEFDYRFFVPVGQGSGAKIISKFQRYHRAIADQLEGDELRSYCNRRYLIVFDDVWDVDVLRYTFKGLPGRSVIVVTTRLDEVATCLKMEQSSYPLIMPFMNKDESWNLLRGELFGDELCPPHLEKAGKKIAENCEGLPLLILRVAGVLSGAEKTSEHWEMVAADKQNPVFEEAYDQTLEVLYPSYIYLPQYLKPCFLYMAVFPQNSEIRRHKLINLLSSEGFTDSNVSLKKCLKKLASNNVALAPRKRFEQLRRITKVLGLHSVFWYLCKKEAAKNKFLHTLNRRSDASASIESQRRLSIYKNVLFAIKDVYDSVASVSKARSLLCTAPYHQYQVPICFDFLRLLRVLDALTIRFYEFPMEVLKLVQLRYLGLTCDRNLPSSITKLLNLQFLIVHQHLSIKFTLEESFLPVEIWYLQELMHLEITGKNLPNPPHGVVLPNLLKLVDVGPHCSENVFKSIPNLEKLRVQIETTPDSIEPLTSHDPICRLCKPKAYQIVVVNPWIVDLPLHLPVSALNVTKLTLSGLRSPWKNLDNFGRLPCLKVLKLQSYAFEGEYWQPEYNAFQSLEYLLIEDTDLVKWKSGGHSFPNLCCLTMRSCYKLRKFPVFKVVELVDCSPSAVAYAEYRTAKLGYKLFVDSSWDNKSLKS